MTKLEFIQWCEANNVPDDAVLVTVGMDDEGVVNYEMAVPSLEKARMYSKSLRLRLGITDTTSMVVEL